MKRLLLALLLCSTPALAQRPNVLRTTALPTGACVEATSPQLEVTRNGFTHPFCCVGVAWQSCSKDPIPLELYATAGAGTAGSPYTIDTTNWNLAKGQPIRASSKWEIPHSSAFDFSANTELHCTGNAEFDLPSTAKTTNGAMFLVPNGATGWLIDGCHFSPGRTVTAPDGNSDESYTGVGATYLQIGDHATGSAAISGTIQRAWFEAPRVDGPAALGTTIEIQGSTKDLRIQDSRFEFAWRVIRGHRGNNSNQITHEGFTFAGNTVDFRPQGYGFDLNGVNAGAESAINFGEQNDAGPYTFITICRNHEIIDNHVFGTDDFITYWAQGSGITIARNIVRSTAVDAFARVVGQSASVPFTDVMIANNNCNDANYGSVDSTRNQSCAGSVLFAERVSILGNSGVNLNRSGWFLVNVKGARVADNDLWLRGTGLVTIVGLDVSGTSERIVLENNTIRGAAKAAVALDAAAVITGLRVAGTRVLVGDGTLGNGQRTDWIVDAEAGVSCTDCVAEDNGIIGATGLDCGGTCTGSAWTSDQSKWAEADRNDGRPRSESTTGGLSAWRDGYRVGLVAPASMTADLALTLPGTISSAGPSTITIATDGSMSAAGAGAYYENAKSVTTSASNSGDITNPANANDDETTTYAEYATSDGAVHTHDWTWTAPGQPVALRVGFRQCNGSSCGVPSGSQCTPSAGTRILYCEGPACTPTAELYNHVFQGTGALIEVEGALLGGLLPITIRAEFDADTESGPGQCRLRVYYLNIDTEPPTSKTPQGQMVRLGTAQVVDKDAQTLAVYRSNLQLTGDGIYSPLDHGTTCNSSTLQQATDAAFAAGGGAVTIPRGTCTVTITSGKAVQMRAGVSYRGHNRDTSIIRLANTQGEYDAIFYGGAEDVTGVSFSDLTIDQNKDNNTGTPTQARAAIWGTAGSHFLVERCRFTEISALNTIISYLDRTRILNNDFEAVGTTTDHDHSTLYISDNRLVIEGNNFRAEAHPSAGARCAIETHGGDQRVIGNTVYGGYRKGMNITGTAIADSDRVIVASNTIEDVQYGIHLWSFASGSALGQTVVIGNGVTLDYNAWHAVLPTSITPGILMEPTSDAAVSNLSIIGNTVQLANFTPGSGIANDNQSSGILLWMDGSLANKNWSIVGNTIDGSLADGIRVSSSVDGLSVVGNTIRNPGQGDGAFSATFRSGILLGLTTMRNVTVSGNAITDDQGTPTMTYGVHVANTTADDVKIAGNTVRGATLDAYHSSNTTGNAPYVEAVQELFDPPNGQWAFGSTVVDIPNGLVYRQNTAPDGTTFDINLPLGGAWQEVSEIAAPSAPVANRARWFSQDNGAGKTQLCARFATGAVQCFATEP